MIMLYRKAMECPTFENVMRHNTGALHIEESRVGESGGMTIRAPFEAWRRMEKREDRPSGNREVVDNGGRFPSNVLLVCTTHDNFQTVSLAIIP